jgi:hypothetical protein
MTNQYFYQPQVIYTRLKDIFNEDKNEDIEDFSSSNFIKPNSIKKAIQSKENKNNKLKNNIITEDKKKYVNKDLVESWIEAIKKSK